VIRRYHVHYRVAETCYELNSFAESETDGTLVDILLVRSFYQVASCDWMTVFFKACKEQIF